MRRQALALVTLAVLVALPAGAGLRTKMIRLVPDKAWVADPGPIAVTVEATASGPKVAELESGMAKWAKVAFEKLHYSVQDSADLVFHVTIDSFDFGSQVRRLVYGGGKARLAGTVVVTRKGKELARYCYSAKPRGGITAGSMSQMAKEVAPPLILKWTKGETDTALHEQ